MEEEKLFSVRDLNLAATLLCFNFQITRIDYSVEGRKNLPIGYFQFQENDGLKETVEKFWKGELLVEPRKFSHNMRDLKTRVTDAYKNPFSEVQK